MQCHRRPLLGQAQGFRAGAGQGPEGLHWRDHGHPKRLCAGMEKGETGMLGPQDTLPSEGGPRLPHVLPFTTRLEQASGQDLY